MKSLAVERTSIMKAKNSMSKREKNNLFYGVLFALPIILGFLIFTLGPMIASFIFSFTDYEVTNTMQFVGLENYKNLFKGEDIFFYKSLKVTFYYVLLNVPVSIIGTFLMALLLNVKKIRGMSFFRTLFYLPSIVPVVATSMVWIWLLNPDFGLFNMLLEALGLPTSMWIYDKATVIPSLVMMGLWSAGATVVIFLAGLQDIPNQLYEAVDVDGGNFLHKFFYITVPMMTPTIFFNLVMGIIKSFQTFAQAYIMTDGGPDNASLFYAFHLYRTAFKNQHMSQACALSWVLFLIISVFTFFIFKSQKAWITYDR